MLNFCINSTILHLTSKLTKKNIKILKLILGGLFSALYSSLMFFPKISLFYSFFLKILFSFFLIYLTFTDNKLKEFLKTLIIFYLISFLFGGCLFAIVFIAKKDLALRYIISNGITYININIFTLIICFTITCLFIDLFSKFCVQNFSKDKIKVKLKITLNKLSTSLNALADTGNDLIEPISKLPVIIVEFEKIKKILPKKISDLYVQEKHSENKIFDIFTKIEKESLNIKNEKKINFRLIPFSSIGIESGTIIGFMPDKIEIVNNENKLIKKGIIAIYQLNLSKNNDYQAIINPQILLN
jgi:stage II sporulation protein GA (sporulation sigma-E factor processing peptidase)